MDTLVSVIVPVYKVEKELIRCLDSILRQTYKNLEILLVDDGSPDQCPDICDLYGQRDDRIKVFHKENGGLSSARNYALDRTNGKYIAFVDSDDWIEEDFIESLLSNIEKENADISIMGYRMIWDSGKTLSYTRGDEYEVFDKNQAIRELFKQTKFQSMVCTNMYKREIFEEIRFPEGKVFEDTAISLETFKLCDRVVYCGEQKYMYYQREGTIFNSRFDVKKLAMLDYIQNMLNYSAQQGGIYNTEGEAFYLKSSLMLILQAYGFLEKPDVREAVKFLETEIRKHKKYILFNPYIETRRKIVLVAILLHVSPKLINRLWEAKVKR